MHQENRSLEKKYQFTAWFYDIMDYYWERQYRKFRAQILEDVKGEVLEAGVGTGRNLNFYPASINLTGIDLSPNMLRIAEKRAKYAPCKITLVKNDATQLIDLPANYFDWYTSFFMFCVMPDNLQPLAIDQMVRVLKPKGKFRILEMIYSENTNRLRRQKMFTPFVESIYGARFDRHTLEHLQKNLHLKIKKTYFVKDDVYLIIEGEKV
ncbi:MAG: class I SAM-dependent methyltransferase [Proteobacteria bacterium]|nr:class I SAM-dependent methyltransferase [Pseudomonadota bacterium]